MKAKKPQQDGVPKTRRLPWTEADLLDGLTPATAHADEIVRPTARELGQAAPDTP
ncbi:hypothetical protein GLV89_09170 [Halomonas alkaliantarctica]|nr:hypothetical protein [Halomonas alkaliantarctica]